MLQQLLCGGAPTAQLISITDIKWVLVIQLLIYVKGVKSGTLTCWMLGLGKLEERRQNAAI